MPLLGDEIPQKNVIRERALCLSRYVNHSAYSVLEVFPYMTISCDCTISSFVFIASELEDIGTAKNVHFQFWKSNELNLTLSNDIVVEKRNLEHISTTSNYNGMSLFRLRLDSPIEVGKGSYFGLFQPQSEESELVIQYQLGITPEHYQLASDISINQFILSDVNINNDHPLVTVEYSKLIWNRIICVHYVFYNT